VTTQSLCVASFQILEWGGGEISFYALQVGNWEKESDKKEGFDERYHYKKQLEKPTGFQVSRCLRSKLRGDCCALCGILFRSFSHASKVSVSVRY